MCSSKVSRVFQEAPQLRYPCGCVNELPRWGGSPVMSRVFTCDGHKREQTDIAKAGEEYYGEFGVVRDGKPLTSAHVAELTEALGPIPQATRPDSFALEVGAGASPYVEAIRAAGYHYWPMEPNPWAVQWLMKHHNCPVIFNAFEDSTLLGPVDFILAAHVLEHLDDAPAAILQCANLLRTAGQFWIVVPDDSDPVNPDHKWMFTRESLRICINNAGLEIIRLEVRRHVEHENFIYASAKASIPKGSNIH